MDLELDDLKHPSWVTAVATAVAYGVLLAVMTAVLFGVPYLVFRLM
ncbi:MAG: hypothetical protein ACOCT0_01235 [Halobacteriota archaeon]